MNFLTFGTDDKESAQKNIYEALQTLQFMTVVVDKEEADKIEKTCELLIGHLKYIEKMNV